MNTIIKEQNSTVVRRVKGCKTGEIRMVFGYLSKKPTEELVKDNVLMLPLAVTSTEFAFAYIFKKEKL